MERSHDQCDATAQSMIDWIRRFASRRIDSELFDTRRCMPPDIVLELGNHGFLGLQVPKELSGCDLDYRSTVRVLQQLGAIDLTVATFVVVQNFLGVRPILNFARPHIRDQVVPRLATGRELAAFALTEPCAGSNPMALTSTAVIQHGGDARLSGVKMWIGNASWASVMNVFLRSKDESGQLRGTAAYVVSRDSDGVIMGPELMTMGMRGMVQNLVRFEDVSVREESILGELGKGMDVAHDAMMHTRLALGAIFLGAQKRSLQLMSRYAKRRTSIATGRLLDNPVTLIRFGYLSGMAHATERLLKLIAGRLDGGKSIPPEFFITCKVAPSEFLFETVDLAIQSLGGRGYLESNILPQLLRDCRVGRIFEGPTETMEHYLGARLLRENTHLLQFIGEELGCMDVRNRLATVVEAMPARMEMLAPPFSGRRKNDLLCSRLGSVVTWSILLSALQSQSRESPHRDDERVMQWVRARMESEIQRAMFAPPEEGVAIDSSQVIDLVNEYAGDIGDIEQHRIGEDHRLDPYLGISELASYMDVI